MQDRFAYAGLALLFLLSRLIAYSSGLSFDLGPLAWAWQIIDPVLLKNDLYRSLWFNVAQPPLFNLLLGLTIQLGGSGYAILFALVYLSLGFLVVLFFYLLLKVYIGRHAFWPSALWAISPAMIAIEQVLFYDLPSLFLLLGTFVLIYKFEKQPRTILFLGACAGLSSLALIRSLFHPALIVCLMILLFFSTTYSRNGLITLLFWSILLIIIPLKNGILYSSWGTSSWFGMNLAKIALNGYSSDDLRSFAKTHQLNEVISQPLFEDSAVYAGYFQSTIKPSGHEVSDRFYKRNRVKNLHHVAYVGLSKEYLNASTQIIKDKPQNYMKSVAIAFGKYHYPVDELSGYSERNERLMSPYQNGYHALVLFQPKAWMELLFGPSDQNPKWAKVALVPLGCTFMFFVACLSYLLTVFKNKNQISILISITATITLYLILAGNLLELGENMRFRLLAIPGIAIMIAWLFRNKAKPKQQYEIG